MPAALKVLASSQLGATTATTIYTVPTSSAVKVASCSITNVSASAVNVTVGVVQSGGTNDGTHDLLRTFSIAAGDAISHKDVLSMIDGAMLDTGATIVLTASTAAALNYLVTGAVIS